MTNDKREQLIRDTAIAIYAHLVASPGSLTLHSLSEKAIGAAESFAVEWARRELGTRSGER